MIWYFDQYGHTFYGSDLYGRMLANDAYVSFQIFCEERKYRYSGILYDKLISLMNMMCFNKKFTYHTLGADGDNGYFVTHRYKTCDFVHQRTRKIWGTPNPIVSGEYYSKLYYHPNPHFVDN